MKTEEWIALPQTISKSKKRYAHFDYRTDLSKCFTYIKSPDNIARHSFYPFIHYKKDMTKFSSRTGKNDKQRDICYASHIDRCIFQYYSFILNELYNQRIKIDGLSEVPIAYRSDLHKTNVFFAKKAFDFIKEAATCYIMIGDYTGFFDNLDHLYLKKQWCSLLGVDILPSDHYALFKNLTKYSFWELEDLLKLNGIDNNRRGIKQINKQSLALSHEDFHKYRSHIQKHKETYGIPQGSPISALLANVYMLNVDKNINERVNAMGGLYMRYSDDFIIVLPTANTDAATATIEDIFNDINNVPGLILQNEKTQFFRYENKQLENCASIFYANANERKRTIDFLGFSFDGKTVRLRSKTTTKYYYKMHRKAKTITRSDGYTSSGTKISPRNLYERYSIKGAFHSQKSNNKQPSEDKKKQSSGNFLTYVLRARKEFGNDGFEELITKRHMSKIRKALEGKEK